MENHSCVALKTEKFLRKSIQPRRPPHYGQLSLQLIAFRRECVKTARQPSNWRDL